ncbi:GmrSD restriction endonuclease domain-containing protein, partial [Mitsuokella multacida]
YLWRLGNLILLDDGINKKISNKSFKNKKNRVSKITY